MKTAKQTVTTEFEPIELNESVKVSFERNIAGDKTIIRGYIISSENGEYLGNINVENGNLAISIKKDDVGKEVTAQILTSIPEWLDSIESANKRGGAYERCEVYQHLKMQSRTLIGQSVLALMPHIQRLPSQTFEECLRV